MIAAPHAGGLDGPSRGVMSFKSTIFILYHAPGSAQVVHMQALANLLPLSSPPMLSRMARL